MTHRDALERFNRATHPDALRELQLAPAETEQPHPFADDCFPLWLAVALSAALTLAGIYVWSNTI